MIPAHYREQPCYGSSYSDPKIRAEHKDHRDGRDCYLITWDEIPLPWVKRVSKQKGTPRRPRGSPTGTRSWHLATGIRKDTGHVQTSCMVGDGPGPFAWRDKPVLDWRKEPGENFCRRCVATWTEDLMSATVNVPGIKVTKGQLSKLLEAVGGTDLKQIELRPTNVEDKPALLAITINSDQPDEYEEKWLVIGNGVVKL